MKCIRMMISGLIILAVKGAFAAAPSGCMIYSGKELLPDPKCACVAKKECASFRKNTYNSAFFNARDENGKAVFSEKIKGLYKESYELFNKVVEMKANGLGHSEGIKDYYRRLNYVNGEIRKELIRTQPKFMASRKAQYEQSMKDRNVEKNAINNRLKQFVKGSVGKTQESSKATPKIETKSVVREKAKNTTVEPVKVVVSNENEDSKMENEFILQNVDKERNNVNETDSLFEIITKTYKKRAYKVLLKP